MNLSSGRADESRSQFIASMSSLQITLATNGFRQSREFLVMDKLPRSTMLSLHLNVSKASQRGVSLSMPPEPRHLSKPSARASSMHLYSA